MSLGLLISGQGTQHPAMLRWIEGVRVARALGTDWRERMRDARWATGNVVAQPLLVATALDAWQALRDALPDPVAIAGYSVGEIAAFAIAGVIGDDEAASFAPRRARAMDACVVGRASGLLAVTGIDAATLAAVCDEQHLAIAIRIGVDRHLVGGLDAALVAARGDLEARGASCTRLAVTVPSHTPLLAAAVPVLRAHLATIAFARPRCALVCDATGASERDPDALRDALAGQVATTIPWDRCMDALRERGVRCVLEIGPGSALAAMWNARFPEVPARSADEFGSAGSVATWVERALE